jgi:hypothetical protein
MPPFDLPDNLFDLMHADLCRPAEVREEYISKPPDDEGHDHAHQSASFKLTAESGSYALNP